MDENWKEEAWWDVALDDGLEEKGKMKQQRRWGEGVHKDNKHTTNMHTTMMIMMQMQQKINNTTDTQNMKVIWSVGLGALQHSTTTRGSRPEI